MPAWVDVNASSFENYQAEMNRRLKFYFARIGASNIVTGSIKDYMLDIGFGTDEIGANDIPILDANGYYDTNNVESALGELGYKVTTLTGTDTLTTDQQGFIILNSVIDFTVNLPTATTNEKLYYYFLNINTGTATLDPNGSETISGDTTFPLYQWESLGIVSDDTNWLGGI